jgi:hypothetical protein
VWVPVVTNSQPYPLPPNLLTPHTEALAKQSTEQKLAAIIKAQGEATFFIPGVDKIREVAANGRVRIHSDGLEDDVHVLQILLDPEGLKAAYVPSTEKVSRHSRRLGRTVIREVPTKPRKREKRIHYVAYAIVNAWLSGGAEAAINTAYDLLPHA